MKDKNVVVFDCFGLFASDAFYHYFKTHYGERGLAAKAKYCRLGDLGELTLDELMPIFAKTLGVNPEACKAEIFASYVFDEDLFALAKRLKEKHIVILLTNVTEGTMEPVFKDRDLSDFFDLQIRSYEIHMAKPDKEIFEYTLSKLPKDHGKVVFFDDNPDNLLGARECGIEAILYASPTQVETELAKRGY